MSDLVRRSPRHAAQGELLGRDAPTSRASDGTFSLTASQLRVALATRERRPG